MLSDDYKNRSDPITVQDVLDLINSSVGPPIPSSPRTMLTANINDGIAHYTLDSKIPYWGSVIIDINVQAVTTMTLHYTMRIYVDDNIVGEVPLNVDFGSQMNTIIKQTHFSPLFMVPAGTTVKIGIYAVETGILQTIPLVGTYQIRIH
jgi:hypothetical protein